MHFICYTFFARENLAEPTFFQFKLHVCPTSRNKIKRRFSPIDQLDAAHRSSRS